MELRRSGGTARVFWGKLSSSCDRIVNQMLENSGASDAALSEGSLKNCGSPGMRRGILHTSSTVCYYES